MSLSRRDALALAAGLPFLGAALSGCGGPEPDAVTERALGEELFTKGARWLWSQQHKDGGWRSETYGLLGSGQSVTAFVLLATQYLPRDDFWFPRNDAVRGANWIFGRMAKNGALGFASDVPDYPVYASSLALHAVWRLRPVRFGDSSYPLLWWLRRQQLTAANGWEGHPAQGGFPMGTYDPPRPPDAPHVDLSMTRAAVQGMASTGVHANDPAMGEAMAFAARCRRPDGSYVYSPDVPALNKGQDGAGYGSATADALQILVANERDEAARAAAAEPLVAMHRVDVNPRVGEGPKQQYAEAMRFYYRAQSARVLQQVGGPEGWADALIRALAAEQDPKGFWRNAANAQKEDDPLLATGFALIALGSALRTR